MKSVFNFIAQQDLNYKLLMLSFKNCSQRLKAEDDLVKLGLFDMSHHPDPTWRPTAYTQDQLNLDYNVKVKLRTDNEKWSRPFLMYEISMERSLTRSLIENIIPPGLLVSVSWVRDHRLDNFSSNHNPFSNRSFFSDKLFCSERSRARKTSIIADPFPLFD